MVLCHQLIFLKKAKDKEGGIQSTKGRVGEELVGCLR